MAAAPPEQPGDAKPQEGGLPPPPDMEELVEDIGRLVRVFARLAKTKSVFVKLEVLADNGCKFWHQVRATAGVRDRANP